MMVVGQISRLTRKKVMLRWAELIEKHALELAVLGVRDNGTEIGMAMNAEPSSAANTIHYYAEALDKIYGEIAPTPDGILGMNIKSLWALLVQLYRGISL